jgi:hypothetical protein
MSASRKSLRGSLEGLNAVVVEEELPPAFDEDSEPPFRFDQLQPAITKAVTQSRAEWNLRSYFDMDHLLPLIESG